MIDKLELLIAEVQDLQHRLVLIVGKPGGGKSALLRLLGERHGTVPINLSAVLGRKLLEVPQRQRRLQVGSLFREVVASYPANAPLMLDNIELLFDSTLAVSPLDLLRQRAASRLVVATWPGELRGDRLVYAEMGHPEYQDYPTQGQVVFEIPEK